MANPKTKGLSALNQRVWAVRGGVHPKKDPFMIALGKFGDPSKSYGDQTRITAPDPANFQRDVEIGSIQGARERATLSMMSRYTADPALLLEMADEQCRVDLYALSGKCGDPSNFTNGGEKWVYFKDGRITSHGFENFGAFGSDEDNPTNETIDISAEDYYEFLYMKQTQVGSATTTREVRTIDIPDVDDCEDCGNQCDQVLATMVGTGATPGTKPVLLYSSDGGSTWSSQDIATMFSNENIADADVIGGDLVIITNEGNEIHYTTVGDVFNGNNVWGQTGSGFVAGGNPNAISSADASHTWIVGNGGYIYFTKNHRIKVIVQNAGVATTQHLQAVHALDTENVLAVGNSNAVVVTYNGGDTWESITGPSVGVNLGACWMWDKEVWFVGEGAGGSGKIWLTVNGGITWEEWAMPVAFNRIDKIVFRNEAEGYIAGRSGGKSYVVRTITGGNQWDILPQGDTGTPIANSYLRDLAVCEEKANIAFAAGLASNGTAGIIVKYPAA